MRYAHAKLAAAALGVLALLLFLPAVAGRGVFFHRDIHAFWYPYIETAARAVAQGAPPVWNPYIGFGRPLLADPSAQLLYPPTWLNAVVQPWVYYTVFVVSHVWLAGLGAFFFARHQRLSVPASTLAAALWMASGPLLSAANLYHHFAGACWTAWVLWALSRTLEAPTLPRAVALGGLAGVQALAGSADLCLITAVVVATGLVVTGARHRGDARPLDGLGRALAVAAGVAALTAAAQWLPVLSILEAGSRRGLPLAARESWSLHPASLLDLAVPRLVSGLPVAEGWRAALFDGRGPLLACLYLGAASTPLVVLGVLGPGRRPLKAWMGIALVMLLALALGRHTPLHALVASAPPYSLLRYPAKYAIPAALCWSILAALGLEVWRAAWTPPQRKRAALVAATTTALALAALGAVGWTARRPESLSGLLVPGDAAAQLEPAVGSLLHAAAAWCAATLLLVARIVRASPAAWSAAAVGLVSVADVGLVGREVNTLAPPLFFQFRPPLVDVLRAAPQEPRLFSPQTPAETQRQWARRGTEPHTDVGWALGRQQALVPPIGARWRISGSYDGDFTGIVAKLEGTLISTAHRLRDPKALLALLQGAGVTHVTSFGPPPVPGLPVTRTFETVYGEPLHLYEVPGAAPRAYLAYRARRLSEGDLPMLMDPAFVASREVILPPGSGELAPPPSPQARGSVELRRPRLHTLEIDVETTEPAYLVVLESMHPGWTATVDGVGAPLLTANFLFRAVAVPAGRHRVEMRYRAPGLALGLALSAAALVLGVAAALRARPATSRLRAAARSDTMPA